MCVHRGREEQFRQLTTHASYDMSHGKVTPPPVHHTRNLPSGGFRGGARGTCPPRVPKFFRFHAVFGKIWQKLYVDAPPGGVCAPLEKSWIRCCYPLSPSLPTDIRPGTYSNPLILLLASGCRHWRPVPICSLMTYSRTVLRLTSGRYASYWNVVLFIIAISVPGHEEE